ncbi:beta strand repeat-containing protein [Alicyclobacillus fodiniaquatilis]|uniref:Beta strand repeat-containing protein n=1 Tax=Alicyclobacillus fodiniaquatilis TaxID=1661150 RepID=A0ABW4JKU1_9BACL
MRKTLTGVVAASVVMGGAYAPVALAATASSNHSSSTVQTIAQRFSIAVDGNAVNNPYELIVTDHGTTTTYLPIWYLNEALKKAGFTATWDGTTWALTTANNTLDFSSVAEGSGNTTLTVNGNVVTKFNKIVHLDPGSAKKHPVFTSFVPASTVQAIFNVAGIGGNLDSSKHTFGMTSGPVIVKTGNTYGPTQGSVTLNKNVVITGTNTNLSNVSIHGNLYVNPGADGTSYIKNVSVTGSIIVLSGASHSVHFDNVTSPNLIVNSTSAVHIVSEGNTAIANTSVSGTERQNVTLEQDSGSLGTVQIASSAPVSLTGSQPYSSVSITNSTPVTVSSGTSVNALSVTTSKAQVVVQNGATISALSIANGISNVSVQNNGKVQTLTNNSTGSSVTLSGSGTVTSLKGNQPTNVTGGSGTSSSGSSSNSGTQSSGGTSSSGSSSSGGSSSSSGTTSSSGSVSSSDGSSSSSGGTSSSGSVSSSGGSSSSSGGTSSSGSVSSSDGSSSSSGGVSSSRSGQTSQASDDTDIQSTQSYVSNVVNTSGSQSVTVPYGLTVQDLENGIASTDGSTQTYTVLNGSNGGTLPSSSTLTTGSELRVTAADNTTQVTYQINILPSNNTEIMDGADNGTYLKSINNQPGYQSVTVAWQSTAQDLTNNLLATDGSYQTYTVTNSSGATVSSTSALVSGDVLTVEAANQTSSMAYQITVQSSDNTQIQDSTADNGNYVTNVSNTSGSLAVNVANSTSVSELIGALQSTDGSTENYTVYSDAGLTNELNGGTGLITGDYLKVTAADGSTTATYSISVDSNASGSGNSGGSSSSSGSSGSSSSSGPSSTSQATTPTIQMAPAYYKINTTNESSYDVTGTGTVGDNISVEVSDQDGKNVTGTTTVDSSGNWSVMVDASGLSDGSGTITATDTTAGLNASPVGFTKDTVVPQLTQAVLNNDGTITLTFNKDLDQSSAQTAANYTVTDGSNPDTVASAVYSNSNSTYTVTLTLNNAPQSTDTISVDVSSSVTDTDGNPISANTNEADYSGSVWSITNSSSGAGSSSSSGGTSSSGGSSSSQATSPTITTNAGSYINSGDASSYTVSGSGTVGGSINVTLTDSANATVTGTATVGSDGTWSVSVDAHTLQDGPITISATDSTNSTTASTVSVTKDTAAPELTQAVLNDDGTITLTFNKGLDQTAATDASNYSVTDNSSTDGVTNAVYSNSGGVYTVTLTLNNAPQSSDTIDVQISSGVTDLAGNPINVNENTADYNGTAWTIA